MAAEETKKLLSSVIISCPKGLTVKKLFFEYKDLTGEDVPYRKFGFPTFEKYLLSIPDICRVSGYGDNAFVIPVVKEQNKHINEMILKQKAPKSNTRYRPPRRSKGIYDNSNKSYQSSSIPSLLPKEEYKIPFKFPTNPDSHLVVLPPPPDYFQEHISKSNSLINKSKVNKRTGKTTPENNISNCSSHSQSDNSKSINNSIIPNENSQLNVTKETNIPKDTLAFSSEDDSDFDEYFNELNFNEDDEEDGFLYKSDSDTEDLSTCMNNLHVSKQNISIPMIDPADIQKINHVSRVNDKIKDKLRTLISEHPDGIWCSKLLKIYHERFKQTLDPLEFGFPSVIQLCDDIPDVFHCIRPTRTDWKIYDSRKPVPDIHTMRDISKYLQSLPVSSQTTSNNDPALPENIMYIDTSYKYPDEVMLPDEIIERQWLKNKKVDDFIEIIISEIYDPSKFWLQLKGDSTTGALDKLMDEMQLFYMHNAGSLQLNELSVRIGLFVSALFMNEFHRAVVIKVFNDQTIKVFYIDYGTVAEVPLRKTCFLHKKFASLPQQAIRARLDNILPKDQNTMWPREAAKFMLNLVSEKVLYGLIRAIDEKQQILHLIVTDTTAPNFDVHINDELVNSEYAVLGNDAPMCASSNAVIPNVHLYPSFDELENGIYPSVGDVNKLLKLGQSYDTIYHGYFVHTSCSLTPEALSLPQSSYSMNNSIEDAAYQQESPICDNDDSISLENIEATNISSASLISTIESPEIQPQNLDIIKEEQQTLIYPQPSNETLYNIPKPPPGFENIQNTNYFPVNSSPPPYNNQYTSPVPCVPFVQNSVIPLQNYPMNNMNQYMNQSFYNMALANPYILNQILVQRDMYLQQQNKLLMQQQREAFLRHQFDEFQRLVASKTQELQKQDSSSSGQTIQQTEDSNNRNSLIHNSQDLNTSNEELKFENMYEKLIYQSKLENNSNSVSDIDSNTSNQNLISLSQSNEHVCERFVNEIEFGNFTLHVLKISGEFYVISQEIVSNVLNSKLSLKKWLKSKNLDMQSFPNKLINLMDHTDLYEQLKKFTVAGVYQANNLGCNIRVTSVKDVPKIVTKYGDKSMLPELKVCIKNAVESQFLWQVLHSSD